MLLRIFKTSQPLSWILITLLLILVRLGLYIVFYNSSFEIQTTGIASLFTHFLTGFSPLLSHFTATLIVILSGFFLNSIGQNINIFKGIHYLLFLIFGLFSSFYPENLVLTPFVISLPITLFSLNIILTQSKTAVHLPSVFNAAFLIGLSSIIYFPSIIYLILLILSLLYLNNMQWRHLAIAIIGVATPWIFFDVTIFSLQIESPYFFEIWNQSAGFFHFYTYRSIYAIGILLFTTIFQSLSFIKTGNRSIIKIRKTYHILFIFLLISIALSGFITANESALLAVIIIPISILFTSFHLETKKWWLSDLLFIAFMAAIGLNYYLI